MQARVQGRCVQHIRSARQSSARFAVQRRQHVCAATASDSLLRSISDMGEVAVVVVDGTQLVSEAVTRHKTAPTASAALGRALLGTLLLGCFKKDGEVTQVQINGDGPLGSILCIADHRGNVKGKVSCPEADPPLRKDGKLNVGAAVGAGQLCVVRSIPYEKEPYRGVVDLVSGEIAEDIASYMVNSEQTNSAIALGVSINRDLSIQKAGGFMIQVLPFCSEETLSQLESNLSQLPSVTTLLSEGLSCAQITEKILENIGVSAGATNIVPKFGPCEPDSLRERMMRAVALLGPVEVKSIIEEQGHVEVTCDFCNQTYQFSEEAIMEYI